MCGIVGYIGARNALEVVIDSLKRLEYRGYDSAGIAFLSRPKLHSGSLGSSSLDNMKVEVVKREGRISDLETILDPLKNGLLKIEVAIGHTRWATQGRPSTPNAHPHISGDIAVVHNGIIENYDTLKKMLEREGYEFISETDSEVLAHLINHYYNGDLRAAVARALARVKGSYAIAVVVSGCQEIVAARRESPLVVGLGDGENFLASDVPALLKYTRKAVYLADGEMAVLTPGGVNFSDLNGRKLVKRASHITWDLEAAEKAGYEHFMLKEIHEQPNAIYETLAGRISELTGEVKLEEGLSSFLNGISRLEIIACGTSYHAGLLGKYLIEGLAGIHVDVDMGSELRYSSPVLCDSVAVAISQSGETADTLAAVRETKRYGCKTMAIVNVMGSTLTQETDLTLYTRAGPEIGVAATKTFTTQLVVLYLLAIYLGRLHQTLEAEKARTLLKALKQIPGKLQQILDNKHPIENCAKKHANSPHYFFLGRYLDYPIALEGALKLKEISYIHAEGYPAGELKHGPLALITQGTPVVAIATKTKTYDKLLNNIKEVKARGANVIAIATQGDQEIEKYVDTVLWTPHTHELLYPLLTTTILQLLAYYTAKTKGLPIDKPRNLAKSVTVE